MLAMTDISSACSKCSFHTFCVTDDMVKQRHYLKRKEVLCLPQQNFKNLYAVDYGALKATQVDANGNEIIKGFYFAGEVLGYQAIYTHQYDFSVVALADTEVCEIPYDSFLSRIEDHSHLQKRILHLMSQELNVGSYLAFNTAEQRIAAFLLDIFTRLKISIKPKEMHHLPMTREDIGNYLKLTAETVSRVLSRLQQKNIILTDHKKISILQLSALKKMADAH